MFNMLALSHEDTEKLLDMETVIEKVEQAYCLKHQKKADLWPMIFHEFEEGVADMDIKSGHLMGADIFGLKLVSWFGPNAEKNLPQLVGTVMVFDGATGAPKAILSAEHITCMRTGAAGAIGAKYLARKDSKTLLIVGTGNQAAYQIAATLMVMPSIEKVYIWNSRNKASAEDFKSKIKDRLNNEFLNHYTDDDKVAELTKKFDVEFEVVENIENAAGESDIIITVTPSRKPMIMKEWIKPGTHFSCVGADMKGKQEIDEELFGLSRVFTDDVTQSTSVGEAESAINKGIIKPEDIISEIGAVITGEVKGRLTDEDITIYDSTGIALQDLITADYAIKKAEEMGVGSRFVL
ncbi:MAG: ornithine cyclodeaminase family protein [Clostridiales bacterium]|nr:ornithine cyclodeaminase family protein [Clostridiales bacterium]